MLSAPSKLRVKLVLKNWKRDTVGYILVSFIMQDYRARLELQCCTWCTSSHMSWAELSSVFSISFERLKNSLYCKSQLTPLHSFGYRVYSKANILSMSTCIISMGTQIMWATCVYWCESSTFLIHIHVLVQWEVNVVCICTEERTFAMWNVNIWKGGTHKPSDERANIKLAREQTTQWTSITNQTKSRKVVKGSTELYRLSGSV